MGYLHGSKGLRVKVIVLERSQQNEVDDFAGVPFADAPRRYLAQVVPWSWDHAKMGHFVSCCGTWLFVARQGR